MYKKIGIIGLGMMGHGIAKNLLSHDFQVTALVHKNRKPLLDLLDKGILEAGSPKQLAQDCEVIILCVTGSPEVEQCIYGEHGILQGCRSGQIIIDCSTAKPDSTDRIAADLIKKSCHLVDAPLARTPIEAEAGRLNTMVGAEIQILESIKPIFEAFCENIFHVGGPGTGHRAKLVNNFLAMSQAALTAEALCSCAAIGINIKTFYDIISVGSANSPAFQMIVSAALEGDYSGIKFSLANGEKDLAYYNQMIDSTNLTNVLGKTVHQSFLQGMRLGLEDAYVGSLIQVQEKINKITIIDQ